MFQSVRLSRSPETVMFSRISLTEQLDKVRERIIELVRDGRCDQASLCMQEYEYLLSLLDDMHRSIDSMKGTEG